MRSLTTEHTLTIDDLVWPLFVMDQKQACEPIASLPGVYRFGREQLWQCAEEALSQGIRALALFAVVDCSKKDLIGSAAICADGFMPQLITDLKQDFPQLGLIADVALDPYTSHGHDGVVDCEGQIRADETVRMLCEQAVVLGQAGADVVAPSDMMDGRVGCIRQSLDDRGLSSVMICSYAVKYASCLYAPFRQAVGSPLASFGSEKASYQLPCDRIMEAMREVAFDIKEGADIIMIKPASMSGDVIRSVHQSFALPIWAYQVSGEYAMIRAAASAGYVDLKSLVLEQMICLKRAGAGAIVSYFAPQVAQWLKQGT